MAPDSVGALRNDLKHCENPDLLAAGFACRANSRVPADFAAVGPGAWVLLAICSAPVVWACVHLKKTSTV